MLYNYLAESFHEMDTLTYLVSAIEVIEKPVKELKNDNFIPDEILRIKILASRDVLIFGAHADIYLRSNFKMVYGLMIRVLDILRHLPEFQLMNDRERYQYKYSMILRIALEDLAIFFQRLSKIMTR